MAEKLAIVGWEEGHAGQIHSWIFLPVACFVHDEDTPPDVDPVAARAGRAAATFDVPDNGQFKGLPLVCAADWPALAGDGDRARPGHAVRRRRRFAALERARAAG